MNIKVAMGLKSGDWTIHVIGFVAKVLLAAQLHFNIQMSGVCGALLKNKACTFFFPLGERRFSALVSILTTQTLHHCVRSFSGASTHIIRVALIKHQYTLAHWIIQCIYSAEDEKSFWHRAEPLVSQWSKAAPTPPTIERRRNLHPTILRERTNAFQFVRKSL